MKVEMRLLLLSAGHVCPYMHYQDNHAECMNSQKKIKATLMRTMFLQIQD
jgi:hypothetical protein